MRSEKRKLFEKYVLNQRVLTILTMVVVVGWVGGFTATVTGVDHQYTTKEIEDSRYVPNAAGIPEQTRAETLTYKSLSEQGQREFQQMRLGEVLDSQPVFASSQSGQSVIKYQHNTYKVIVKTQGTLQSDAGMVVVGIATLIGVYVYFSRQLLQIQHRKKAMYQ